jgi:hypothetical protein
VKSTVSLFIVAVAALTISVGDAPSAQENTPAKTSAEEAGPEGAQPAPRPAARRRPGPNIGKATIGEAEISLMAGHLKADGRDCQAIDTLKAGDLLLMTEGVALKLKTSADLDFGAVTAKAENVAPNYPGVYSIWFRKAEDGWTATFNEKPDVWGTQHRSDADVGTVPAAYARLDEPAATLTLGVDDLSDGKGRLRVDWGDHQWTLPFAIVE